MKMKKLKFIASNKWLLTALVTLVTLGLFLLFIFLYPWLKPNPASASSPNVILISVDTLRADHMGVYGYERDTTPNIDKLALASTVFERAYTPVPCTDTSYASLFSGLYPQTTASIDEKLDTKYTTITQGLKGIGYRTAGFFSNAILANEHSGLARGFDTYDGINVQDQRANRDNTYGFDSTQLDFQRASRTTEEAGKWLQKNDKNKFFLFVQYVDPHLPYGEKDPSFKDKYVTGDKDNPLSDPNLQPANQHQAEPPSQADLTYLTDRYDENISYTDYYIGKLLDQIKDQGLMENSIIIFTADHGENFEPTNRGHCYRLNETSIHIPLIVHDPLKSTKRVSDNVSLIDVYPTLVDRVGMKPVKYLLEGMSLKPALDGEKIVRDSLYFLSRPAPADRQNVLKSEFIGQLYSVLSGTKKVVYNEQSGKQEAFDLQKDPKEQNNIFETIDKSYYEKLMLWVSNNPLSERNTNIDQNRYNTLKGLGYL